jgi:NitT/TauT family transport system substrate-binding protein
MTTSAPAIVLLLVAWLASACVSSPAGGSTPASPARAAPPAASDGGAARADSPASPPAPSGAAAPAVPAAQRTPLNPPVKVQAGYFPGSGFLPLFVAADKGYFQEEGLEVELTPFAASSDQFPALASGQIDVGGAGADVALFNAIARGIDAKIVAYYNGTSPANKGLAILVRQDLVDSGQYREPRDFQGLTIGVNNPTASSAHYLEMALTRGGLTLDDVDLTTLPYPDMLAALSNKRLDAAVQTQPFIMQAESQGLAKSVFIGGELAPGYPFSLLIMGSQFRASQPEAAKRFVLAFLRGQRDVYHAFGKAGGNKDEMYQLLMKYTPIKDPTLTAVLAEAVAFGDWVPNGQIALGPLAETQDFFVRRGAQQERLNLAQVVDTSYGEYAVQQLGRLPEN